MSQEDEAHLFSVRRQG